MKKDKQEALQHYTFYIRTELEDSLPFYDGEPDKGLIASVTCEIRDGDLVVGEADGALVLAHEVFNEGVDLYEVFDARSQALCDAYTALYDDDGEPKNDDAYFNRVLYLTTLNIEPAHRGRGLGLVLLRKILASFDMTYVIFKPFPLQHDSAHEENTVEGRAWCKRFKPELLPSNFQDGVKRLRDYYKLVGFESIKGTPLMGANTGMRLPDMETVLRRYARMKARSGTQPTAPGAEVH
jgi:ribosomal protein S18 acetylase RimI-like enzyme